MRNGLIVKSRVMNQRVEMVRNGRAYATSPHNSTITNWIRSGLTGKNRQLHSKIEYYVAGAHCGTLSTTQQLTEKHITKHNGVFRSDLLRDPALASPLNAEALSLALDCPSLS